MKSGAQLVPPWGSVKLGDITAKIYLNRAEILLSSLPDDSVDLIVTSPPYCLGKEYDESRSPSDFLAFHRIMLPEVERVLKKGGSVCWQTGHHVKRRVTVPLDALVYMAATEMTDLVLRNRIIWTFGHGTHAPRRFSGRHETVLWFTKGDDYVFNLDSVRVPQKYPGKRHYKGEKKGKFSGNPLGKNPSDLWDIPNVKAKHVEKTDHPCQFPVALPLRLVKALTKKGDLVLDPFLGSGSSAVAALSVGRNFIGCDIEARYLEIALGRLRRLSEGKLLVRPDSPPRKPLATESVAKLPSRWQKLREKKYGRSV